MLKADRNLEQWRRVLAAYATLQRLLIPACRELLHIGVRNCMLAALPAQYADLLADAGALLPGAPDGMSTGEYERLVALAPCRTLRASNRTNVHPEIGIMYLELARRVAPHITVVRR